MVPNLLFGRFSVYGYFLMVETKLRFTAFITSAQSLLHELMQRARILPKHHQLVLKEFKYKQHFDY